MQPARFRIVAVLLLASVPLCRADSPDRAERRERLRKLIARFDENQDGRLSAEERAKMREFVRELTAERREPIPQSVFPGETDLYKLADGPHEIEEVETHVLADDRRDKHIPLRITVPVGEDPAPLVIFCHGALGSKDGAGPLATYWASHGYVVIRPTFGDSISLMSEEELGKVRSPKQLVNSRRTLEHWDDRPRDVSHVIDSLDRLGEEVDVLAGRIDAERIAVAGHSFGAHTTMLLAGLRLDPPGDVEAPDFHDPRVSAFVMISPQGPGGSITPESYRAMRGPLLMITGDNDGTPIEGRENQTGAWRRKAFDACRPGDRYLLWIEGACHGFGGINGARGAWPGRGPDAPDHVYYVKSTALAFFDAYLRDDADARTYLRSGRIDRVTEGASRVTAR